MEAENRNKPDDLVMLTLHHPDSSPQNLLMARVNAEEYISVGKKTITKIDTVFGDGAKLAFDMVVEAHKKELGYHY